MNKQETGIINTLSLTDEALQGITLGGFGQTPIENIEGEKYVVIDAILISRDGQSIRMEFQYEGVSMVKLPLSTSLPVNGTTLTVSGLRMLIPFRISLNQPS